MRNFKFKVASAFIPGEYYRVELPRNGELAFVTISGQRYVKFTGAIIYYSAGDIVMSDKDWYMPLESVTVTWNNGG